MPFPLLGILGGLSSLAGIGGTAYGIGTGIRDRNRSRREEEAARRSSSAAARVNNPNPNRPGNFWEGTPATQGRIGTYNLYTPEQQQAFNSVLQRALGNLNNAQFSFDPIEQKAREGFNQQTIPSIAERFTSMGSGPNSGAFNRAVAGAGKNLETDLASARQGYNFQQQALLQNLLGIGLQPQFESYYQPGQEGIPGFRDQLLRNTLNPENISGLLQGVGNMGQQISDWRQQRRANNATQSGSIQAPYVPPAAQGQAPNMSRASGFNALYGDNGGLTTPMAPAMRNPATGAGIQRAAPVAPRRVSFDVPTRFNPAENTQFSGFFGI